MVSLIATRNDLSGSRFDTEDTVSTEFFSFTTLKGGEYERKISYFHGDVGTWRLVGAKYCMAGHSWR